MRMTCLQRGDIAINVRGTMTYSEENQCQVCANRTLLLISSNLRSRIHIHHVVGFLLDSIQQDPQMPV